MHQTTTKKNPNHQTRKAPNAGLCHAFSRPGAGRSTFHKDHSRYDRKAGKAVQRD